MSLLNLPWRRWDLHIVDCKDKAVAFNIGVENADAIVKAMNRQHYEIQQLLRDMGSGK